MPVFSLCQNSKQIIFKYQTRIHIKTLTKNISTDFFMRIIIPATENFKLSKWVLIFTHYFLKKQTIFAPLSTLQTDNNFYGWGKNRRNISFETGI